jgi:ABC-2 type transport system ATP-binding protein
VLRVELWALFHALAVRGVTLLVSSHVMEEATRCDRLLLIRSGEVIADATLPELLLQTGADDAEEAFLRLVDGDDARGDQ